jgi:hypothetical protein
MIETGAMAGELALSTVNDRRLGPLRGALETGRPAVLFKMAKSAVISGFALRLASRRDGPWTHHVASMLYLGAGMAFRFAWVGAGRNSAADDAGVAGSARASR